MIVSVSASRLSGLLSIQELPHDPHAILRRIPPQHRAKHLNGLLSLPVVRPRADVADVRAKLVDDLLDVLKLLRGEIGVVEQPIKFFAVFVFGAHEIHGAVYKAEHVMALLDALRLMLQLRTGEIRAGQILHKLSAANQVIFDEVVPLERIKLVQKLTVCTRAEPRPQLPQRADPLTGMHDVADAVVAPVGCAEIRVC